VTGPDLGAITEKLRGAPGVEQMAVFGATLHVTGSDGAALEAALRQATAGSGYRFAPGETGLEDVFIHLMQASSARTGVRR
jgi:ABC-2 type transport system ATP-binding protein